MVTALTTGLKDNPEPSSTILLIEDDQPTRELYQRELSRNYQVFACDSENEALALLHTHSIRAIILEPGLHRGQGWDFLATLQALLQNYPSHIIVCSTLDERRRGLELGAEVYLIKPVLPITLSNVVWQVIHNQEEI